MTFPLITPTRPARTWDDLSGADQARHWDHAEEAVLADSETFTDWLAGKCIGVDPAQCRFGYVPRDDVHRMQMVEALTVAQLAAALLQADRRLVLDAAVRLRELYLSDPHTVAAMQRVPAPVMSADGGEDIPL